MKRTKEQQVATKIANTVSDVTLDLDEVGKHLANNNPTLIINRLNIVLDSAISEKEETYERHTNTVWN